MMMAEVVACASDRRVQPGEVGKSRPSVLEFCTRFEYFWRVLAVNRWATPERRGGLESGQRRFELCTKGSGNHATARVAPLVLLIASVPHAKASRPTSRHRALNHSPRDRWVMPVKLDRQLSAGCMEHANCMVPEN